MLIQRLISSNKYGIKCPYSMEPIGICIHNTANDASAANEISYMQRNNNEVSFHIAIDDKEAIQGIPFNRNAWAAGDGNGQGNRRHIHVEICYSKSGGEKFEAAEKRAAQEVAILLRQYGWDIDRIKDHRCFSGKNCPHRTDMNKFKSMVQMELCGTTSGVVAKVDVFYKVFIENRWLPEVKNLDDYAGIYGKEVKAVECRLTSGDIDYRTANLNCDYYPWVNSNSDYAGDKINPIDKLQIRQKNIKYRVHLLDGNWLPWVIGLEDYAGIRGIKIDGVQVEVI